MKIYQKYIDELKNHLSKLDESRFVAQQLLRLHQEVKLKVDPLVVELGVDKGQSTKVFLNAIEGKNNAKLISIDIENCRSAVDAERWEFVQQDSSDIKSLLIAKPIIKSGIDVLYVDSLHTAKHVQKEIYNFFEYLNKDAYIFLDDIDSGPYMFKQRKDSAGIEIANRKIYKLLEAIFRANIDKLDFEIMRGSTGLGVFRKRVPLGEKLNSPILLRERNNYLINKIFQIIFFKKSYRHNTNRFNSFLISPDKNKYK
ncbi:class I SAM-dependent methyltransferase [Candidatus Pelagibacter sp.]|nr:class I SAM-dependent methyltransferase [Candidatus Pelagibacter sp.]